MTTTQFVFGNFFETELTVGVTATGTILFVPPSMSAALPVCDPNVPSQARLVLWDGQLPPEIVACTINTQNGQLTVVRAQEGTVAQAWSAGTQIRSALTAEIINNALAAYFNIQQVLASAFLPLTGGTLSGPLTLSADPTAALHAATKQYVDNVQGNKLPLTGGTMQGTINMNSNRIISLPAPVTTSEPARLLDVQNEAAIRAAADGDNSGKLLTAGTGSAYTVASNSSYSALVDGISLRVKFHATNLRGATLAVDTTAAKPIQILPGSVIPAGALQANAPVSLVYSLAFDSWLCVGVTQPAFTTGDYKLTIKTVADPGWIMCNDQTIGNTSSGATFADASAQELFILIWNNISNTNAPVTGGRGASGLADWTAQKPMAITKMLGRALAIAGTGSGLSTRALGDVTGEETHLLTTGEMPAHNHGITDPGHAHSWGYGQTAVGSTGALQADRANQDNHNSTTTNTTGITINNAGGGGAHNNMQPSHFGNVMLKL